MPSERYEVRIPFRRLLIAMLLTVAPISLAGLYTIAQSEKSLEKMIGAHFRTIAQSTAAEVSQFVHDRVVDVGVTANDPAVLDAIITANRAYAGTSDAAVSERIQRIERMWNSPAAEPVVKDVLATRASNMLRRHQAVDPRFLRITVTDGKGAVVSATHKTLDYFQGDEDFWQAVYAQGRGSVNITDIRYDEVTKSYYIGIGAPVVEEGTNRFIGMVDALIDVSTLFPFVNRVQIGPTARASLVREDGTIIVSPETNLSMNLKSESYAAVRDLLSAADERQTGYVVTSLRGGARKMIGFADTGLKANYKNLGWTVLVTQDAREAFAATRAVGRLLSFVALVGLAAVVFLGVYFSLHRAIGLTDIQTPEQVPAGRQDLD